ncbi:MAG: Hint domain-containing protein [Paracoccus sp. (in: a-proteobacteria)]
MPLVTFSVYRTTIVDGVATGDSELVEITIDDADDSGSIDRAEWGAYTGDPNGHIGGTVDGSPVPALWESDGGATNSTADGFLYTAVPITEGTDVLPILEDVVHAPRYNIAIDQLSVCFLAGTLIATPTGERAVEDLRPGDLVLTRDHGPQPLVWTGHSAIDAARLDRSPNLRPVCIAAGALGDGLPRRDLRVSAQHRMLLSDGAGAEYLAAAIHLHSAGMNGARVIRDGRPFDLVHLACADHEILFAEGAATESFFPGPMALRALSDRQKADLRAVFPELESGENPMTAARPFLTRKEAIALLDARAGAAA